MSQHQKSDYVRVIGEDELHSLLRAAAKAKVYRKQLREVNRAHRLLKLEYQELKRLYDAPREDAGVPAYLKPAQLAALIDRSLIWDQTPQKFKYWNDVFENLKALEGNV